MKWQSTSRKLSITHGSSTVGGFHLWVKAMILLLAQGVAFNVAAVEYAEDEPYYSDYAGKTLPELMDLQQLAAQANNKQLPALLLFSAEWCEYCQVLKEQVLNPMMQNEMYEGKWVLLRHVGIDEDEPLTQLDGSKINKADWAYQLNADLTPTVLFIDSRGQEVAERIVGISEVSLFAALVHSRLNDAYQNMGLERRIPPTPEQLAEQHS